MYDYLVVGAGFAGSVVAERLARGAGRRVLVVDRRPHIGGNAHDLRDAHGIRIHAYGPHIFHTNSSEVFGYLTRFTAWRGYEHRVLAAVDGKLLPMPINLDTVNGLYGLALDGPGMAAFLARVAEPRARILNSEDVVVAKVGRELFEKFYRGYTRKQWGCEPAELAPTVAGRLPVRLDRDDRYFTDRHQAMPASGYDALFQNMLDHDNISVVLGHDWREVASAQAHRMVVYTGAIDAYFDHRFGPLPYRSLEFRFETHERERVQRVGTINHPNDHDFTRVTEFKHLTGQAHARTTLAYEYPRDAGDPYYPVPRPENQALYQRYHELAQATPNVRFCGRLGTYRYYNMDQVVAQALALAAELEPAAALP